MFTVTQDITRQYWSLNMNIDQPRNVKLYQTIIREKQSDGSVLHIGMDRVGTKFSVRWALLSNRATLTEILPSNITFAANNVAQG